MLLYLNDWKKYPNAAIHYTTKNTSFLRLAEVYNKMGVENCFFHLAILQPELIGVDPFDENLPLDIKSMVLHECKENFWYYLREVSRIPVPGSTVPTNFIANRANIALYWMFFNHITVLIVILRQTGKTTVLLELCKYLLNFGSVNTLINLLTKSEKLKAETLEKLKATYQELPEYLNYSTKHDIFNRDEVKIAKLGNGFKAHLSSSSDKQAEKVCRGSVSPINLIDEAAFIENIAIALGAMLMTGNAARSAAAANGKNYGTVLATTAGNINDREGKYIYGMLNGSTILDEKFFDSSNITELNELIYKNSSASKNEKKRPIVNISLSYRQLGYDEEWLKKKLEENYSTPENLRRDLFNQWHAGSNTSPIKDYLEILNNSVMEVMRSEFYEPYNYLIKWSKDQKEIDLRTIAGNHFIIGVDTSDGVGGDDITLVMRDHTDGEVLCTGTFNDLNLITLADFFVSFLLKYTNSTMIIERRSSAPTIIDYIIQKLVQKEINPFTRLYNTIFQNKELYEEEYEEIMASRYYDDSVFIKYKKHLGFATSASGVTSRSELYSATLLSMLKYTATTLYDGQLITQICSLEVKNNRINHPDGGNDDLVIAALLSYWLLTRGKNLRLYGIDTTMIMKSNKIYLEEKYANNGADDDGEELARLESNFNQLLDLYRAESNPLIAMQLAIRIKKMASEINVNNNIISAEELLESINREKRIYGRR